MLAGLVGGLVMTTPHIGYAQQRNRPLVFDGVTVIDVEHGRRVPAQRVVVVGNRIQAIGDASKLKVPVGARVVSAKGQYMIPGLWDLHVHPMMNADLAYPLFIANGVTGVRDAGSSAPLSTLNRWKQEIAAGTRTGPRLIVSGQAVDGNEGRSCDSRDRSVNHAGAHHICVSTPAEARLAVDFLKMAGADMLKTYDLSRELYLEVTAEARRIGLPFGGHSAKMPGLEASDSGAWILDHQTWFNPNVCGDPSDVPPTPDLAACTAAAQRLRKNNTWVAYTFFALPQRRSIQTRYMPNLIFEGMLKDYAPTSTADWAGFADSTRETNNARVDEALARMHAAGIPFVIGTDAAIMDTHAAWFVVSGFSVHETLVRLVLKGKMTPLEALQTATLNPALALRVTDSLGTVAPGKIADLVLLDADPLVDIWNTTRIHAVVANGRYFDRPAIDALLQGAERTAERYRHTTTDGSPRP